MRATELGEVDLASEKWIKASRSSAMNACVELAAAGEMILLRDSKNPETYLRYTVQEIEAFLDGAKRGEFDHLVC